VARQNILIVEDDEDIQQLVSFYLIKSGFGASCADSGEKALEALSTDTVDCVLLDIMLPGLDGIEVCRRVREMEGPVREVPVIMLTAREEDNDIVAGFEAGADDYVSKPFSPKVLISRIRAVLRRGGGSGEKGQESSNRLVSAGITIDLDAHSAAHKGGKLELTMTEFGILAMLMRHPGRVYSRNQIIETVRGYGYNVTSRSVDVQIHGIRKKLGDDSRLIETVRGVGYRFTGEMEQ
jgi:two-component system phosphate regulon response regulator PhoB